MIYLESELTKLKEDAVSMAQLVLNQLKKSYACVLKNNLDTAKKLLKKEKKVDKFELKIDENCERILALYNPVAIDLRFVLAVLKINHDLESMGDNATAIVKYLKKADEINKDALEESKINEVFPIILQMLENCISALKKEDTGICHQVFNDYDDVVKLIKVGKKSLLKFLKKNQEEGTQVIMLLSIAEKLEREASLLKNIGEEIVFYLEAKVLKHRKKV